MRSALAWRWGSQVLAQIVAWTSTIVVVRLLDPSDYGLFAMTQAVIAALNFLSGYGFATSLIQSPTVDARRIAQVFGLLIVSNVGLALAQFALAPVAADYYGEPAVAPMLRVQALIFLATPFIALPSALLARRIEFRSQGLVNLLSSLVAAVTALALAWLDYGVWALVIAPIAGFATRALGLTIAARLLVWPVFDFRGAGDIVSFGGALTLCQLFWIVQSQSDILIAGRMFSPHELGLYSEALFLALIFTGRFLPPLNEVAFPAYAELHKSGRPIGPAFLRSARTVMILAAPLYIGLGLTAFPLVATVFGPKWLEMAPIAAGVAFAMPALALQIICSPATNALSRPRIYLLTSLAGAVIMPLAFLIGVGGGVQGLVHAWWVAAPLLLIVTLALTLPAIGLRFGELIRALHPIACACAAMAVVVLALRGTLAGEAPPLQLLALVAAGAATYGIVLCLGWPHVVRETLAMLRHRDPAAVGPAAPLSQADAPAG
ncbi:oligosaccharide flippase family protein [Altererythrobacter soli]|uniref:Oligosaccharide flippase family protein n=1 Tax=Croceibacterium soli TaxID=1739690 RepID=A0A6I4UX04_9SPHN|nr:oligosaccharide flippase family protein [Croceibacterium soli]